MTKLGIHRLRTIVSPFWQMVVNEETRAGSLLIHGYEGDEGAPMQRRLLLTDVDLRELQRFLNDALGPDLS